MTSPPATPTPALPPDSLVTVIGGGGFIGRYVVQRLAAAGHRIRVVVRNPEGAYHVKPLGGLGQVQIMAGDIRKADSMARAFAGADAGINLVGILDERGGQTFADTQAAGAGHAAGAAAAAGVARFVQVSAIGADAGSAIPYARSKGEGEAAVAATIPGAAILRPSIVAGPEDQFFNRFARMAAALPVLPVIAGDARFQPVHVSDIADAVVTALDSGASGVFELGGPEVVSFRDVLRTINRLTGRERVLFEVADFEARLLGRLGDLLPFMPMTSDQYAMLKADNVVSAGARTLVDLGITPTPMAAYLPRQLEAYRPKGRFNQAPPPALIGH